MKINKSISLILLITIYILLRFTIFDNFAPYDFAGWEHGAAGYKKALKEAIVDESPLILYFHTDWCDWCRKMNSHYLASEEIREYLRDILKVEINPEKGDTERSISRKYGVTGFPSFFVFVPAYTSKPEDRIYPFLKKGDMTSQGFLKAIKKKIANEYNNQGYKCYKNKDYENALQYYKTALVFNPENAYAYYGIGVIYHSIGYNERNEELFEKAEENYLKALEINPDHLASKKELEKLRTR